MTDGYMVPTGQMDTLMGDGWMVLAGRASRVCWTLPVAPGAHRGGDDQGKGCRWEREWSWCPVGQRGRGPRGEEAPDRRTEERAGLRRAEPGGNSCQSPGSGRPQKAQEAGWGVSWSLPCLPLIPTAPAGSVGAPLTARDRARGMGGRLGRGQGARDRSAPGGGTGRRQRQKGPEARVGSPGRAGASP